ncbi:hypothetical protein OsJ_03549 [Oryza sativa Japonica Group]|uniref:Peptidase S54 rhomboid domain-containing protein n=1 Tax=Oryza sativa subsp. japonica TaxID=39947 RepID=B9ET54_ORYSJ|nr:hypothetical protein OsJ_03549 [Oryza sativa Japonica Group]
MKAPCRRRCEAVFQISNMFGPAFLLKLYVAGALAGSAFFLLEKAFLAPRRQFYGGWDNSRTPALGASAAANAIILLDIFLYPKKLVYLYFFIPIPAAIMGAILIGADLLRVKEGLDLIMYSIWWADSCNMSFDELLMDHATRPSL